MNILIVEDEELAVKKLKKTLLSVDETANVVGEADSIRQAKPAELVENAPNGHCGYQFRANMPRPSPYRASFEWAWDRVIFR